MDVLEELREVFRMSTMEMAAQVEKAHQAMDRAERITEAARSLIASVESARGAVQQDVTLLKVRVDELRREIYAKRAEVREERKSRKKKGKSVGRRRVM
jgi:citrate lyase beta subunit